MLTSEDIDFSGLWPNKGRMCIFTDSDRPCATMLVFVHGIGEDPNSYYIEYVRPTRGVKGKVGPVQADDLTPVEHFGYQADYDPIAQVISLKHAKPATAHYKGNPELKRQWQGHTVTGIHTDLAPVLDALYG